MEEIAAWKNQQAENWGHKNRPTRLGESSVTISKGQHQGVHTIAGRVERVVLKGWEDAEGFFGGWDGGEGWMVEMVVQGRMEEVVVCLQGWMVEMVVWLRCLFEGWDGGDVWRVDG